MKNLKRIFSLALAGTMLAGMLTVGASAADFTDADTIVNQNAVDTMVALNIIKGNDDGSFAPERTVSRAEMAKMITVALNGGKDPVLGTSATPKFTDIGGHWAQKYIEYCANLGIISGRGDGTFDPNGTVTGTEAAKMMLVAMGYNSTVFNFTGADWAINVNTEASNATPDSLYTGIEAIDPNTGLSRDNAAQLIFNGIQDDIMTKSPEMTINNGEISYRYSKNTGTSILTERYKAQIWVGTYTGNSKTNTAAGKGEIVVDGKLSDALANVATTPAYVPSDMDISNIGEEVKVLFKDGTNSRNNRPDKNDTIYGVFNTGATTVYNITKGQIQDGDEANGKIKFGDTSYEVGLNQASTPVFTLVKNYDPTSGTTGTQTFTTAAAAATAIEGLKNTTSKVGYNGDTIKFVTNTDGKITYAYVVESDLAVVLAKNAEKITLNNGFGSIKIADNEVYEDVKKDDVVVVTRLYDTDPDDGYTIVEKAEKVTGEVKGFKTTETVTVADETYKIYDQATLFTAGLGADAQTGFNGKIGEEFDLYLVNGYVRAAVQITETASNWSVVLEAKSGSATGSVFGGLELQVMDAEGTKSIIKVSKDTATTVVPRSDASKLQATDIPAGSLITYTVNKSNEAVIKNFVSYTTVNSAAGASSQGYNKDTKTFGGVTTSAECVIFVNTKASVSIGSAGVTMKAYKIRDLGDITAANAIVAKNSAGDRVVAAVIDLQANPVGAASTRVYGIITAENGSMKVDNDQKDAYTASVNGEDYTLYLTAGTLAKGDIVSFEPANDNIYADVESTANDGSNKVTKIAVGGTVAQGWVREYAENDGTLTVWGELQAKDAAGNDTTTPSAIASYEGKTGKSTTYAVTKDTKFYFVDQKNDKGVEAGSITEFDPIKGLSNVIVVFRSETKSGVTTHYADVVIFETSGDKDILTVTGGRVDRP